ncbi:MAG: peptidase M61, partial [Psychroserpens sp.]|nr:peptidase M61 [Psychroserpens sp.]
LNNSFWKSQNIQAGDVIKKVNGKDLTIESAQQVIGGMFGWQEGHEITMDMERDGEPYTIKTTLTKAMATTKSLGEDENASEAQVALR